MELLLHLCECGGENSNIFFSLIVRFTAVAPILKDRLTREKHGDFLFIAGYVTCHGSLPRWKLYDKGTKYGFILFLTEFQIFIYFCSARVWTQGLVYSGKHISTEAKLVHFCASVCEAGLCTEVHSVDKEDLINITKWGTPARLFFLHVFPCALVSSESRRCFFSIIVQYISSL